MTSVLACRRFAKRVRSYPYTCSKPAGRFWREHRVLLLLLTVPLLFAHPKGVSATTQSHREHKRDYRREILAIEEEWRNAQLTDDFATMERLLADDYFGISMTGQPNDKMQQIERMRNRAFVMTKIDLSDVKIKLEGRVAIVTSKAQIEGHNEGTSVTGSYRYTRIYRRYPDASWKITNFEVTKAP